MTALYIVPILAILILIHEIGHYATARLFGIRVLEFGIGIPPRVMGITRNGILYSLNLLPIGGFVKVLGEDGKSFSPDSLQAKSKLQRATFMAAGSFMNFLLAFLVVTILVAAQGESRTNVYVSGVEPDSPAAAAGWQIGDQFLEAGGQPIDTVNELVDITRDFSGQTMPVTIQRGTDIIQTEVTPRVDPPPGRGPTGIQVTGSEVATLTVVRIEPESLGEETGLQAGDRLVNIAGRPITDAASYFLTMEKHTGQAVPVIVERDGQRVTLQMSIPAVTPAESNVRTGITVSQDLITEPLPWWQVVPRGAQETLDTIVRMFRGILMLIQGDVPFEGLAGPIGMGQLTSEVLEASSAPTWVTLANIMVLLSLNLAILNLLPFPALDGGRLLFVGIEAVRGKRISPEKEGMVHFVGLVILLGMMLVIAFVDIDRLVSGQALLR